MCKHTYTSVPRNIFQAFIMSNGLTVGSSVRPSRGGCATLASYSSVEAQTSGVVSYSLDRVVTRVWTMSWSSWAPVVYGLLAAATGVLLHVIVFPSFEMRLYGMSKQVRGFPILTATIEECVAHGLVPYMSRCVLAACVYGRDASWDAAPRIPWLTHGVVRSGDAA